MKFLVKCQYIDGSDFNETIDANNCIEAVAVVSSRNIPGMEIVSVQEIKISTTKQVYEQAAV